MLLNNYHHSKRHQQSSNLTNDHKHTQLTWQSMKGNTSSFPPYLRAETTVTQIDRF